MGFAERFELGRGFENQIARMFLKMGWSVIPFFELGGPGKEAPRYRRHVLPDMLCHRNGVRVWVECKVKRRMWSAPATGIHEQLYEDYLAVQKASNIPVWLIVKDGEEVYGGRLDRLEVYAKGRPVQGRPSVLFKVPGNFRRVYSK